MGNEASTASGSGEPSVAETGTGGTGIHLFQYDASTKGWVGVTRSLHLNFYDSNDNNGGKPDWHLEGGESDEIDVRVSPALQLVDNPTAKRVTFELPSTSPGVPPSLWAIRFAAKEQHDQFIAAFHSKSFENAFGLEDTPSNQQKIFGDLSTQMRLDPAEAPPPQEDADDWADAQSELEPDIMEPARGYDQEGANLEDSTAAISAMKVGALDNSFVLRGADIRVMRNTEAGVVNANVAFAVEGLQGGEADGSNYRTPPKLMLQDQERKMNMLTPQDASKLIHADLTTGTVVSEYTFKKNDVEMELRDIQNDSKAAQLDSRATFLGVSKNGIGRWDTRTAEGHVQDLTSSVVNFRYGKDYAKPALFSCAATSGDGYVVTGSEDGTVRLYNNKTEKSLNQASSNIPSLGAPVTEVDVSYDSKYIVATTPRYVMLIKASYEGPKGETTGFASRMGAKGSPPRLLKLSPEDQAVVGLAAFSNAKFSFRTTGGKQEQYIVASCGQYTVLWTFKEVRETRPELMQAGMHTLDTGYVLIPKDEAVVDSCFMHEDHTDAMLVATKHEVWTLSGK